jgi:hypothetical protein
VAIEILAFLASDLFKDERITKPLSQKTGMEIIAPVIDIARADFASPTQPSTV